MPFLDPAFFSGSFSLFCSLSLLSDASVSYNHRVSLCHHSVPQKLIVLSWVLFVHVGFVCVSLQVCLCNMYRVCVCGCITEHVFARLHKIAFPTHSKNQSPVKIALTLICAK